MMSDDSSIKRHQQQVKHFPNNHELNGSDIADINQEGSPMYGTLEKEKGAEIFRKHSSISSMSDSHAQNKKPASIDEIKDLYSALNELVKTNVTTTPILERKNKTTSAENSPHVNHRFHDRTSTVPEKELRKLAATSATMSKAHQNISPSVSLDNVREEIVENQRLKQHKRGLSSGTFEMVNNIKRISPFPSRKFSHDVNNMSGGSNAEKSRKKEKNGKKSQSSTHRNSANLETNKKWKGPRLFQRFRSKSSQDINSDEEYDAGNNLDSSDESESSPRFPNKNRRSSEGDALKLHKKKHKFKKQKSNTSVESQRSDVNSMELNNHESFQGMDNTVCTNDSFSGFMSPEQELSSLESWFEQAAAEVAMKTSSVSETDSTGTYTEQQDEPQNEPQDEPQEQEQNEDQHIDEGTKNKKKNSRKKTKNRGPTVKRSSSNIMSRKKEEKKSRKIKNTQSFDESSLVHSKSTPNLSREVSDEKILNNAGTYANSKVTGRLSPFTENNLKGKKTHYRKISLDRNVTRLPNTPLFYIPTSHQDSSNSASNLKILKADKKSSKQYNGGIFYSEEKNYTKGILDKTQKSTSTTDISKTPSKQTQKKVTNVEIKRSLSENQQTYYKTRPQSMFDFYNENAFIDEKTLWTLDSKRNSNIRNSLHIDSCIEKDDNANFFRANNIKNSHALSMCDLSKTNYIQVHEKSLWERLRKGSSSKKSKVCK